MRRKHRHSLKSSTPKPEGEHRVTVIASLATAEQIAEALQVTPRTIHYWAKGGTIPTAFRCGRVVRFNPLAVASVLGITLQLPGTAQGEANTP